MTLLDEIKSGESRTLESAINSENGDKMEILIQKSFEKVRSVSFNVTKLCSSRLHN